MSDTEATVTMTEAAEAVSEMTGGDIVPLPAESIAALLACGDIIQGLIFRAWDGLENSNRDLLVVAAGYGLIVERDPTDDEIASGKFEDGDVVLMLSPVFEATMSGYADGLRAAAAVET